MCFCCAGRKEVCVEPYSDKACRQIFQYQSPLTWNLFESICDTSGVSSQSASSDKLDIRLSLILHRISSPPTAWRRQPLKEECCVSSFARCKRNLQNDIPIVFTAIVKMRSHRMHQVLAVLLCPYGNSVVAVPCAVSIRRHKWPNPAVAVHAWDTCCALSSSLSAPAAKSPAQRQYSHGNSNLSSCCQGLMYSLEIRDLGRAVFGTGIPGRPPFQIRIRGRPTLAHKQKGIWRR